MQTSMYFIERPRDRATSTLLMLGEQEEHYTSTKAPYGLTLFNLQEPTNSKHSSISGESG